MKQNETENKMTPEKPVVESHMTLRDLVLRLLDTSEENSASRLKEIVARQVPGMNPDDLLYGVIFELEVLQRMQEHHNEFRQESEAMLFRRLSELFDDKLKIILEHVLRQQIVSRGHFWKLFRIYRESFINKALVIGILFLFTVFAGLGVFYFYKLILG